MALYESFSHLYTPNFTVDPRNVLAHKYPSAEQLGDRFVVYSHGVEYRVYDDMAAFLTHLEQIDPAERVFHEVIFSGPQKLKFDIDAPVKLVQSIENIPEDDDIGQIMAGPVEDIYKGVFDNIREAISTAFFIIYNLDLPAAKTIICESRGDGPVEKFSNHIIIDGFYVSSHVQAAEFTQRVKAMLPECYWKFLDFGVNKRTQNFRIESCRKVGDDRVKRVTTGQPRDRTIVGNISGCVLLPDIKTEQTREEKAIPPDDIEPILAVCSTDPDFDAHRFKRVNGTTIIFERVSPSACCFCKTEHTRDSTMYVWAPTNDVTGMITVYKYCRRYTDNHPDREDRRVKVGEFLSAKPIARIDRAGEGMARGEWVARQVAASDTVAARTGDLFGKLEGGSAHIYNEPTLRQFETADTLVVRAAMKMGKTKALAELLERTCTINAGGVAPESIIRFVSFRQTFSSNIKEKFPEFTLYNEVTGPLAQDRLIIQVESLHRLYIRDGCEPPDLLILDECESIFEQFGSGLLRGNFNRCFAVFQYLLRFSKRVICMDANVGDRTYRILNQMRPRFAEAIAANEIVFHWCQWKNGTDDKYYFTGDKVRWTGILYASVDADERVAVPMTSLKEAKILEANLINRYPTKVIRLYSSEGDTEMKKEHFSDVHTYWTQCDVLIYTPTVSAGVSFELKHFSRIFGLFIDQSCPVETCQQMIGRIRDVSHHEFFICLAARGNNQPETVEDIRHHLFNGRKHLYCDFDESGLVMTIGADGTTTYTGDFLQIWLENARMRNLSKNSFVRRFTALIRGVGSSVKVMTDDDYEHFTGQPAMIDGVLNDDLCEIENERRSTGNTIRARDHDLVANSEEMTEVVAEDIRVKLAAQERVSAADKAAYGKYRLRVDYRYDGPITRSFVATYADPKVRRRYKNLSRLVGFADADAAIDYIKKEELATHQYFIDLGEPAFAQDIVRKYVFNQHRYAFGLVRLCGWASIYDQQMRHHAAISRAWGDEKIYWESINTACIEFGIRRPTLRHARTLESGVEKVKYMLKFISQVVDIMYGVSIRSRKNDPTMFFLSDSGVFTVDEEAARRRNVPLIGAKPWASQPKNEPLMEALTNAGVDEAEFEHLAAHNVQIHIDPNTPVGDDEDWLVGIFV